ncbi:unnamed protein product, partial [Callosobruchus maculatus]
MRASHWQNEPKRSPMSENMPSFLENLICHRLILFGGAAFPKHGGGDRWHSQRLMWMVLCYKEFHQNPDVPFYTLSINVLNHCSYFDDICGQVPIPFCET